MKTIPDTYTVNNSDFDFTEVAAGGTNNRGYVMRRDEVEPHGANHYTSLYGHAEDFAEYVDDPNTGNGKGSCRGYAGAVKPGFVPFDIDRSKLEDALTDNRKLTRRLVEEYSVPKDAIRIYYSGLKGFHDELPAECFGGLGASVNAPQKVKELALRILDGMETDTAIYDRNRLWRTPNTMNRKPESTEIQYKIPLTYDELQTLSIDEIRELARSKRTVEFAVPAAVPALIDLKDSTTVTLRHETPKVTDEKTDNLVAVIQEFMPPKGERHLFARVLAGYLLPRIKRPRTMSLIRRLHPKHSPLPRLHRRAGWRQIPGHECSHAPNQTAPEETQSSVRGAKRTLRGRDAPTRGRPQEGVQAGRSGTPAPQEARIPPHLDRRHHH